MLQAEAEKTYNNYGAINHSLLGMAAESLLVEVEAWHRVRLEWHMDQVVDLVSQMVEVVGTMGDDQNLVNMETDV